MYLYLESAKEVFPLICRLLKLIKKAVMSKVFRRTNNSKTSKLYENRKPRDTNESLPIEQNFALSFKRQ
jgi:hypothetical protein